MAEDRKEKPIFKSEGLETDWIERKRYNDSREWVQLNNASISQRLLNHRSLWQKIVDWGHQYPITYAAIVTSTSLLIMGGLLLSVFLGGMPLFFILVGLPLIIPLLLPVINMIRGKTSTLPIQNFFGALNCQYAHTYPNEDRKTELTNALRSMGQSMRTEAKVILDEYKKAFDHKVYVAPSSIQAKEKIRQIVQEIPEEFPLAKDFTGLDIARCYASGETKDTLGFRDLYSYTSSGNLVLGNAPQTSENAVKFFIQFVKEVFGIEATCEKGKESDFSLGMSGNVSGAYYCEVTEENVTKILNADISEAKNKAKQFYKNWEACIRAKSSIISALDEFAKDDKERQEIVTGIKAKLKFTQSTEKGALEGKFKINFHTMNSSESIASRNAKYSKLQNYLNDKFGENTCQLNDASSEAGSGFVHVNINLFIKLTIITTRMFENKTDLTASVSFKT